MDGHRVWPGTGALGGLLVQAVVIGACSGGEAALAENPEGGWRPLFAMAADPTTPAEHGNYHLRVEFRRTKGAPTSAGPPGGSGILYHLPGDGQHADGRGEALELRVDGWGCGDFFGGHDVVADVEGVRKDAASGRGPIVYRRGRGQFTVGLGTPLGNRTVAGENAERPAGEWNLLELLVVGRTSVHLVNGRPVMVLHNLRRQLAGKEVPLTRGRIRLVSAGPDVLFRDPQIRSLGEIPASYLPAFGAVPR